PLLVSALAAARALLASTGSVLAGQLTVARLIDALAAKASTSRVAPPQTTNRVTDRRLLIDIWCLTSARPLTAFERRQVAAMAENRARFNLDIPFVPDSAVPARTAIPTLVALGGALSDPYLKNELILIVGHADGAGGGHERRQLAERRAQAIKRFLVANFIVRAEKLVAVGYGHEFGKDADPCVPERSGVEITNLSDSAPMKPGN